ncbi:unnamed protein product, partial [Scytosiphon promiscuus]
MAAAAAVGLESRPTRGGLPGMSKSRLRRRTLSTTWTRSAMTITTRTIPRLQQQQQEQQQQEQKQQQNRQLGVGKKSSDGVVFEGNPGSVGPGGDASLVEVMEISEDDEEDESDSGGASSPRASGDIVAGSMRPSAEEKVSEAVAVTRTRGGDTGADDHIGDARADELVAPPTKEKEVVAHAKENIRGGVQQQQQQQEVVASLVRASGEVSSEDETVATARKMQPPPTPAAAPVSQPSRAANVKGRERLSQRSRPPPSPSTPSGRSSIGSLMSPESMVSQTTESADDSDSAFDESFEGSWGESSEAETEDDSDDYELDVLPPNCGDLHKNRKTFKAALCEECFAEYNEARRKAGLPLWDSDTRRRRKRSSRRRTKRGEETEEVGGRNERIGTKRPRGSPGTSCESNGDVSSDNRTKRRKLGAGEAAAAPGSAAAPRRRLVKPLVKRSSSSLAPSKEAREETRPKWLEDTSSSDSDGGSARPMRVGKRAAARPRATKAPDKGAARRRQDSEGAGGGGGADFLGTLIGNRGPPRKTKSSSTTLVAPSRPLQGGHPNLLKQSSTDSLELAARGRAAGAATAGRGEPDGRAPPQLGRRGSSEAAATPLSLKQYKTGVAMRNDAQSLGAAASKTPAPRIPNKSALIPTKRPGAQTNGLSGKKR